MREKPIEGIDYYVEGRRTIFTERYHLKRGFCCNCHCRHCPWKPDAALPRVTIINSNEKKCEFDSNSVVSSTEHDNSGD